MPIKTFADTNILNASDVNTYLMKQSLIVCTSTTRPSTPNEGMAIYETDTDKVLIYSGSAWEQIGKQGAWVSYAPTLGTDGAGTTWAIGNGTLSSTYAWLGNRTIAVRLGITFGTTTTFGSGALMVSVPFNFAAWAVANTSLGTVRLNDTSLGAPYLGHVKQSSNVGAVVIDAVDAAAAYDRLSAVTSTVPFTWADTDTISALFIYETAS